MAFADRLTRSLREANEAGLMDASSRVEKAKAEQQARVVERNMDQAVHALQHMLRTVQVGIKNDENLEAVTKQVQLVVDALGKDGNLRMSLLSLLTMPKLEK